MTESANVAGLHEVRWIDLPPEDLSMRRERGDRLLPFGDRDEGGPGRGDPREALVALSPDDDGLQGRDIGAANAPVLLGVALPARE